MSSGTLTYVMATQVHLSMALTMKMKQRKHPVQMMKLQRFLFIRHLSSMLLHVHTPSDEPPTPPHVRTPSKLFSGCTPSSSIPPAHSDETMSAAQILADLAEGGVGQLEPEPEAEEQVVFEDQTLEEIDIDILVSGVQRPTAIKFKPLSLFCRKPAGARLGVHVGKQKGLKRNSGHT